VVARRIVSICVDMSGSAFVFPLRSDAWRSPRAAFGVECAASPLLALVSGDRCVQRSVDAMTLLVSLVSLICTEAERAQMDIYSGEMCSCRMLSPELPTS
jgi:hypothetical protein